MQRQEKRRKNSEYATKKIIISMMSLAPHRANYKDQNCDMLMTNKYVILYKIITYCIIIGPIHEENMLLRTS